MERTKDGCRPDLVAKYSLLLSNTHSISTQLGQPPHASSQSHRELERNLSRIAVFPGKPVDQSLDYRVGVLLRTKQVRSLFVLVSSAMNAGTQYPEIEDAQRSLLDALPADLKHKDGEANEEDLTKLATATQQHDKLIRFALRRLRGISGIDTGEEEDSEDEEVDAMQQDEGEAPQYDWRMRLEPEQPAPSITANAKEVLQGVAAILRDGR